MMSLPTACIDDLPWEMIRELFEYLPPKDLVVCSMVNRRWHSVYAAFKRHRLAATDYDLHFIKVIGSKQPIREAERCCLWIFRHLVEKPLLSNLKHLALSGRKFDLNNLNRFQQLLYLDIGLISLNEVKVHLNLPKLRVLAFYHLNSSKTLSIDCPELGTLLYHKVEGYWPDANPLDVKHPETIQKLKTNLFGKQLAPFKGVECLVTINFRTISQATLLSLPRLRELRYERQIAELVQNEFDNEIGTIDRVKRTLSEFMDEAKKLRGSDFQFTFAGLQLTNVKVDQIDFGVEVYEGHRRERVFNEYVYMKNYHLIIEPDALHFVNQVDYILLLSNVTGKFPLCFSQKFTGIEFVKVNGLVKDPDHLLLFLKSLRSLRDLRLEETELNQEFYDQLPVAVFSLVSLYFGGDWETELELNFDFISQFSHLSDLLIYPVLSVRAVTLLVRWLGGLKHAYIHFWSKGDRWIKKGKDSRQWKIAKYGRTLFETENLDAIVNFLQR